MSNTSLNKRNIYDELVRMLEEGNRADDNVNSKVSQLLVLIYVFIGYLFTNDTFLDIYKLGSPSAKIVFVIGSLFLIVSFIFLIQSFLLKTFMVGIELDRVHEILDDHPDLDELDLLNHSLNGSIKINDRIRKQKNAQFFRAFIGLIICTLFFVCAKLLFYFTK